MKTIHFLMIFQHFRRPRVEAGTARFGAFCAMICPRGISDRICRIIGRIADTQKAAARVVEVVPKHMLGTVKLVFSNSQPLENLLSIFAAFGKASFVGR